MAVREKAIKYCDLLLEIGWLAVIFFVPLIFSYWQANYSIFELPKAVFFCLIVELMSVVWIVKIFLENKISFKADKKFFILILILLLSQFASLFFSLHPWKSWLGSYERRQGVYIFLHYTAFFLLLIFNLKNRQQAKKIIIAVLASSAIVCAYGLLQFIDLDFIKWDKSAFVMGRIFSSLGQPNFLGHWLIMVLPLAFYGYFKVFKNFYGRFFILLLCAAQIICLILSYSRSAWLGLMIEIFAFFIVYLIINKEKRLILLIYSLFALIIINILFFGLLVSNNQIINNNKLAIRFKSAVTFHSGSNQLRLFYWQSAVEEIKRMDFKELMFGYGQENQDEVFVKHYRPDWALYEKIYSHPDRAHNSILDIILTSGIFGLALIGLFYSYIISQAIKYLKSRDKQNERYWLTAAILVILAGYFINNLFSFSLTASYVYLFSLLAVLVYLMTEEKQEKNIFLAFLSNGSKICVYAFFIIAMGIFSFLYNIKPAIADYYLMEMDKAKLKNDCSAILNNLNKAIKWHAGDIFYKDKFIYNSLNCLSSQNDDKTNATIKENIEQIIGMIDSRELSYYPKINIAHAYALFGYYFDQQYYNQAELIYQELIDSNPNIAAVYKDWGRMKLWQKDYGAAVDILKNGADKIPPLDSPFLNKEHKKEIAAEVIEFYYYIGEAYSYQGDYGKALPYYEKIIAINPYYPQVYKKIADMYYLADDLDKTIWYNNRGYILDQNNTDWLFNLIRLCKEQGDQAKISEYVKMILALKPGDDKIKNFVDNLK